MERTSDYLKDLERSRKELNAVLDEVEERLGELRQDAQEYSEQLSLFDVDCPGCHVAMNPHNVLLVCPECGFCTYAFPFRQSREPSNDEGSG